MPNDDFVHIFGMAGIIYLVLPQRGKPVCKSVTRVE
jgi:hypothetical protein